MVFGLFALVAVAVLASPFSTGDGGSEALGDTAIGDTVAGEGQSDTNSRNDAAEKRMVEGELLRNATEQPGWRPHTGPVPVLMYHVIDDPQPGAPYRDLYVSAEDFRAQIQWLVDSGYEGVTLRQVEEAWWREGKLPEKPVVLSFDDGYISQYEVAFVAMSEQGWPGLLNLKAGDDVDIYKRQVREMLAAGWELGSHTVSHPDLTSLSPEALVAELSDSRRILRRRFGVPVSHLCYPAGRYNDAVATAAEAAGYSTASTTDPGLATREEPFRLKRIRVNRGGGAATLASAMSAAGA